MTATGRWRPTPPPELERQAAVEHAARLRLQAQADSAKLRARVDQLEQQQRPAIDAAPVTRNHLHLYGLSRDDMSEMVGWHVDRPALEDGREW